MAMLTANNTTTERKDRLYGEVMAPLDIAQLPMHLKNCYDTDPLFKEWLHLADKVHRAEKISSWTQWTAAERSAYAQGDTASFSRLRGYTEAEIADFIRYMDMVWRLDGIYGDGFCQEADFVLSQIVKTEQLQAIELELRRLADI